MATSGSTSVQVTAYDTLKFNWVQYGQSTTNNYTLINWSLQLVSGSAGKIISSAPKNWVVTVNGTKYSGTSTVAIENNSTTTLTSGQTTIYHNDDGTKTFSYSFSQEFNITFAGASVGTKSGSGTGTLNTIPRATTPSLNVSSIDMGGTVTIYTPRASSAFTHDLAYSFAGSAYVTIQNDVATSVYWLVPLNLANSIPNTTNGTITIRCITKNGTTVVGTKTVLLTAKVPTTIIPTISSVTLAEAATGTAITNIGAYVQSKSKVKATISASGVYGSTISSYASTFEGKNYKGASFTTDTIVGSGTLSIKTTITDSRGRTATKTTNLSVLSYKPPQITTFHVARYNEKGEADPNGENVWITRAYSVTSLNSKNTASLQIDYKTSEESTWTRLYNGESLSADGVLKPATTFSTDYQWDFKLSIADAFTTSDPSIYTAVLPSGAVILDIRADGKGIAFFKTSTKEGVDIDGALPNSAINLTSAEDLNDLTTPGFYAIPSSTISATIQNIPFTDNATACLEVKRTGVGAVKQIIQKASTTDGAIYERDYNSSGWGAWHVVYSGAGRLLWSGSSLLTSGQTITFNESMAQQQSGVVLIFSRYTSTAQDYYYSCHFIPKLLVTTAISAGQTAAGVAVSMATSEFDYIAAKYLRMTPTGITGDATNNASGTKNGITYNNGGFALRYVIGV